MSHDTADAASFQLELDQLSFLVGQDVEQAAERAEAVSRWAIDSGEQAVLQRARMVIADAAGRRGRTAELGIVARQALAWGMEQDDRFVVARAHRLLSTFYEVVGDGGTALEHAVAGVDLLPEGMASFYRGDHETRLAAAHVTLRSFAAARDRFTRLLHWAEEIGDQHLRLRSLNNLAYLAYADGRIEESGRLSVELIEYSRRSGIPLSAAAWDTLARTRMSVGDYAGAERTLINALAVTGVITEVTELADLHVSIAVCRRMLGRFDEAAASLDVAQAYGAELGHGYIHAEVVAERSELAAATGDYRTAFELYRRFHGLKIEQLSAAKDARARILAAVFETDEAVRAGERYREMSERDHLTGLHNRRYAETVVAQLLTEAARTGTALSVGIADLDHFKRINDTFSHQTGDEVLQRFAQLMGESCPPGGLAVRLGGEEFLLVLNHHDPAAAREVCEGLRRLVSEQDWSDLVGDLPVTVSIGIATVSAALGTWPKILAEADRHLYQAKRAGRNRLADSATTGIAAVIT